MNVADMILIIYFVAHEDDVNAVAFVDTPTHVVASGGDDGLCKIWDRRALRESHPVMKHEKAESFFVRNFLELPCSSTSGTLMNLAFYH